MKMTVSRSQGGFTLIEMMLSMAFLGVLITLAAALTMQTVNIYSKGVAMKQVNQAGRAIVEDIARATTSGSDITIADNGSVGYLCIHRGGESRVYVWNSLGRGYGASAAATPPIPAYTLGGKLISLARVDNQSIVCPNSLGDYAFSATDATEMLSPQVRILSVDIVPSADEALSRIAFWIGTCDGSSNCVSSVSGMRPDYIAGSPPKWSCPAGSLGSYCAFSKFEAVIYTPNKEE